MMNAARIIAVTWLLPLVLGGCAGVGLWGNLLVVAITVGIFIGTLTLGRAPSATRSQSDSTESRA